MSHYLDKVQDGKLDLTWDDVYREADRIARFISLEVDESNEVWVLPVPRGGIYAAMAIRTQLMLQHSPRFLKIFERGPIVGEVDFYIDDLVDSGATRKNYDHNKFLCLIDKPALGLEGVWVSFPWERMGNEEMGPEENIRRLIQFMGDDPMRPGLVETPKRVIKSYSELFSGYKQNPADIMKVFPDIEADEMITVSNIEFFSTCEHHMLPFSGYAHVGYIPGKSICGLSKIPRLVDIFSRRLQVQERLTMQITQAMDDLLEPAGAACVIDARHMCVSCRGVKKQDCSMRTTSLLGVFGDPDNTMPRQEFLASIPAVR